MNWLRNGFRTRTAGWEFDYSMALAHPLHPLQAGRKISVETGGMDDVFPSGDHDCGPYTQFIIIYIPCIIATFWVTEKKFPRDIYIRRFCVAMTVCQMIWYCYFFPAWFQMYIYFNFIVQESLHYNMEICTMWHWALVSCTSSQSIGLFWGVHHFCFECHHVFLLLIPWWCSISSWRLWLFLGYLWPFY